MSLLSRHFLKINNSLKDVLAKKPSVGVGIINFNGAKHTLECVESIAQTTKNIDQFSVIVVLENGSRSSDVTLLEQNISTHKIKTLSCTNADFNCKINILNYYNSHQPLLYIKSNKNLGFCTGYNLIAQILSILGTEYLLALNNDARIRHEDIEQLVKTAKETKAAVVSSLIMDEKGRIWYIGGKADAFGYSYNRKPKSLKNCFQTNVYSGCCALFHLPTYLDLKGMRDSLFICLDEPEFSQRIKNSGKKIYVEPRARAIHEIGATVGLKGSRIHNYFWVRNRFFYSQFHNTKLLHFIFILIYSLLRLWRWLIYLKNGKKDLIKIELLAIIDFCRNSIGPGSLWQELNSISPKSTLWNGSL